MPIESTRDDHVMTLGETAREHEGHDGLNCGGRQGDLEIQLRDFPSYPRGISICESQTKNREEDKGRGIRLDPIYLTEFRVKFQVSLA